MRTAVQVALAAMVLGGCTERPVCTTTPEPQISASGAGHHLHAFLQDGLPRPFSGVVFVERRGEILLHGAYGFGDPRACSPSDTTQAYWLGSLSKQFAAVAILKLAEGGGLRLSDRIEQHLPSVPPDKSEVTVHHLLTHTSGLPNAYSADGLADRGAAMRAVLNNELESAPGETYSYSNDAYSLVAAIVESVSGRTFEAYLHEALIAPLGLTRIGLTGDSARWNSLLIAERALGAPRSGSPQLWATDWGYKGGTGVLATAADLSRWFKAVRGGRVLTPSGTESLFTSHIKTRVEGLSYGYGWYRMERDSSGVAILHNGDDDFIGHSSSLRWNVSEDFLVIVLSNEGYWDGRAAASVVGSTLADLLRDATR